MMINWEWYHYLIGSVGTIAVIYYIAVLVNKHFNDERKRPIDFAKNTKRYNDLGTFDNSVEALTKDAAENWQRPLKHQPVNTDLPRLCKKTTILTHQGNTLYSGFWNTHPATNIPMTVAGCIREILILLAMLTKETHIKLLVEQSFDKHINDESDISAHLNDYFTEFVKESSEVYKILKLCTQSAISAAVYRLKSTLGRSISYKDVRGAWTIDIIAHPDKWLVIHKKREQSWLGMDSPSEYIEFQWVLEYQLDTPITKIITCNLYVDDLIFGATTTKAYQDKVRACFTTFYKK